MRAIALRVRTTLTARWWLTLGVVLVVMTGGTALTFQDLGWLPSTPLETILRLTFDLPARPPAVELDELPLGRFA